MESPVKGRAVIDIGLTVKKHKDIVEEILPAHALSGCDTVACCFGIGKGTVLKILRSGYSLRLLGNIDSQQSEIVRQATKIISACYGAKNTNSMSETRVQIWAPTIKQFCGGHLKAIIHLNLILTSSVGKRICR
jgi:hypothetical protein